MTQKAQDRKWMRRALALARRGQGQTRPNPPVGAVVVKSGHVIGQGYHRCAGGAHAEVVALDACKVSAAGATLYVTLEPCCTHGRTPPCTERIIREGITRVVVGCHDVNACHCGRGLEILAAQGIKVAFGVCESETMDLAAPFFKHVTTGYPFVTLKLAMTLDGRIADRNHSSQWITGLAARAEVQCLRRRADAVMVGAGTICHDDPSLLCRDKGNDRLLRVVVDGQGQIPPMARVLTDAAAERTIVATLRGIDKKKSAAYANQGARVWTFAPDKSAHVPLRKLLKRLGDMDCMHLLCEGGGHLAGALHDAGLVDEYCCFYAPAVLGDRQALCAVTGRGTLLADMPRMHCVEVRRLGDDVMMRVRKA